MSADEIALGARLLATLPTHEGRPEPLLRRWSATAADLGAELADRYAGRTVDEVAAALALDVVEETGGIAAGTLTLARYGGRPPTVRIHPDAVVRAEAEVTRRGWRTWFPPGAVRDAALAHELAHHLLHGADGPRLKRRLDHVLLRVGPVVLRGHVLGADELVAHAFARRLCGLAASPLLISAALSADLDVPASTPVGSET
ncbi:hypothetical protein [Actinocatenispora rupis]|uniref:Uncharacterized protein n=1 Tax=Actinocatenispora rupis TaxID=519421 RepID=A0A8J3JF95_9ACTN|nr:hypothetical protein [Actinocatenispora rupis]GID15609.1 hypothetical protein Aru02nite_64980 [Actinocatenispora rupis]